MDIFPISLLFLFLILLSGIGIIFVTNVEHKYPATVIHSMMISLFMAFAILFRHSQTALVFTVGGAILLSIIMALIVPKVISERMDRFPKLQKIIGFKLDRENTRDLLLGFSTGIIASIVVFILIHFVSITF